MGEVEHLPASNKAIAAGVTAMLQRWHLPEGRPAGGLFAAEIGSPDGTRRADAIWAPFTHAGGGLIGYEVKVSRSDLATEIRDPAKCDPWARYCTQWYIAVSDPAICEGLDVPEHWGIVGPPSGRRTVSPTIIRKAPVLHPIETGPGWKRIAAYSAQRHAAREARWRYDLEAAQRETARVEQDLKVLRETGAAGTLSPQLRRMQALVALVQARANEQAHGWLQVPDEQIVDACVDSARTMQAADRVRRHIETLLHQAEAITQGPGRMLRDQLKNLDVATLPRETP